MIKRILSKCLNMGKILLVWIFLILFFWAGVDIFLSLKGELPLTNHEIQDISFEPNRGYMMRPFYQNYWTYINSYGMRREEIPEPQFGEKHILALGDSTCYSSNSSMEHQWPVVIERALRKKGAKENVMNGGVPA